MSLVRPLARSLARPLPHSLIKGVGGSIISSIFADGTDGLYFDFSKTDQTFLKSGSGVGGAPADDAGENIGQAMESHAWQGRTLAQEIASHSPVVIEDFSGYADQAAAESDGWTFGTGWSLDAANDECDHSGGVAGNLSRTVTVTNGMTYKVTFDVRNVSAGFIIGRLGGIPIRLDQISTFNGSRSGFVLANSASPVFFAGESSSLFVGSLAGYQFEEIPGNHGLQITEAAQPKRQTGGLARFDGSDDNLLTTLNPAASFSMLFKGKITSASKVAMGSRATTDTRAFIGTDAAGLLAGGVGADSTATIKGGSDIRGTTGVGALVYNPSTVSLYWNGAAIYSGAINGTPNTTIPLTLGAFNDNGTAGAFADADIYHALAIKKALTAAQIAAITNLWGTS